MESGLNRRQFIGGVAAGVVAGWLPQRKPNPRSGDEWFCYADVKQTLLHVLHFSDAPDECLFSMILNNGDEVWVTEDVFDRFHWLYENKCYMVNQNFCRDAWRVN